MNQNRFIKTFSLLLAFMLALAPVLNLAETMTDADILIAERNVKSGEEFSAFLANLEVLESYAGEYAPVTGESAVGLVINYIRTGIEKYNTGSWAILAGPENTAFVDYVAEQDVQNGTAASDLRGIGRFTIPNGQTVEFAHMFGALNIAYYNAGVVSSQDFGSWAGDICDLMEYAKNGGLTSTGVEEMTAEIAENYFGIDDDEAHSFGYYDVYGDLDAFYIMSGIRAGGKSLTTIMKNYFGSMLSDSFRASFFLSNRFPGIDTRSEIRNAVYEAYRSNSGAQLLEGERGLTEDSDLRYACCYVFADYLYELAKDFIGEQSNDYYTVFSTVSSAIAPGVTQQIRRATTADDKQIVYYIGSVDIGRNDLNIYANYGLNDASSWRFTRVTDQMAAAQEKHSNPDDTANYIENYNAVMGVNADFYNMTNAAPAGALVMNGVQYNGVGNENFFAILDDGTPIIGSAAQWQEYSDRIVEAVGGSIFLVRDGQIVVADSDNYYNTRASRTCVGITSDNRVILMALDGRQEPFSAGGSAREIAQIMYEAGCVVAINLDGGGSTTFAAKEEGADEVTVVNRPSDGFERSVSSSILVVSTATTSDSFHHAVVASDYGYLTPGTTLAMRAVGVSETGNAAELPEGTSWRVSDETIASIDTEGILTAIASGDVEVELVLDGVVLGSKTMHVAVPDAITFTKDNLNAIYGVPAELPITATCGDNAIAINAGDIVFEMSSEDAGSIEGFSFIGNEESGIRQVIVAAVLAADTDVFAFINVSLFGEDEAIFNFDSATAGDRGFAWYRDVANSELVAENHYHSIDPDEVMTVNYTFALDMSVIEIPERIKPLIGLLPGGDDPDATAWDFLLQLAERVSVLTEVRVVLSIDPNFDADTSSLTLSNEYFTLSSAVFNDEEHTLTIVCNWIDQTQAIDPTTANPICIVSGLALTPKADAVWDENSCINASLSGDISYDIYLRTSTLYNIASNPNIQEQYGIYPFINPNDPNEKGGHFGEIYRSINDSFTLDKTNRQGWYELDGNLYYFIDNVPVTGIRQLPGHDDAGSDYYYHFDDNGVCLGKLNGLFTMDGGLYYCISGELKSGWWYITDENDGVDYVYFFNTSTYRAVNGAINIWGYNYVFENYRLVHGDLRTDENGTRYRWAGQWVYNGWRTVDGNTYYFGSNAYAMTGVFKVRYSDVLYVADENGVWMNWYTGTYEYNGGTHFCREGILVPEPGLVYYNGHYYYFCSTGAAVKNCWYWPTITNGLLPAAMYYFDENGWMTNPPSTPDPGATPEPTTPTPEPKNGIVAENGSLYYYVDNVLTPAGLILLPDGYYYYVRTSNCEVVHGRSYWVTVTNGLMPQGMHTFDDDGRMIDPPGGTPTPEPTAEPTPEPTAEPTPEPTAEPTPEPTAEPTPEPTAEPTPEPTAEPTPEPTAEPTPEPTAEPTPEVKDGIVAENGSLYYYIDGQLAPIGLFMLDGYYYYARTSNGEVVHGRSYWVTVTNDLMPQGMHHFDDEGRMTDAPKNGIVEENGSLYYYIDGELAPIGLFMLDGYYYYARTSSGEIIHGRNYWVSVNNGLLPSGMYYFDDSGRMTDPPEGPANGSTEN